MLKNVLFDLDGTLVDQQSAPTAWRWSATRWRTTSAARKPSGIQAVLIDRSDVHASVDVPRGWVLTQLLDVVRR